MVMRWSAKPVSRVRFRLASFPKIELMIVDWYGNDLRSIFRKLLMKKNSKSFANQNFQDLA